MFTVAERERVRALLVEKARTDMRVVAAAAVGGSAGEEDRWSDLDLSFGVADGVPVEDVLNDWTQAVVADFDAAVLFDLPLRSTIYRVFLLPGALQVDLSFAPAAEFGALGPRFRLLFGHAVERSWPAPPSAPQMFGLGVHHLVRARACIERSRLWQAEYWLHEARDEALSLACLGRGLEARYGRRFDDLPREIRESFGEALVRRQDRDELRRALAVVAAGLLREGAAVFDTPPTVQWTLEMLQSER